MKKIFLLIVLLAQTSILFSQVEFGLKASYNYPIWKWNYTPKTFTESVIGGSVGFYMNFPIGEDSEIRPGLDLSAYEFSLSEETGFSANYLEIPILIRKGITRNKRLFFYSGLGLGFNISELEYYSSSDPALSNLPILGNYKDSYLKPLRLFIPLGIAYEFPNNIAIDLGYNLNINNMGSEDASMFVNGFHALRVSLAYTFRKK